MKKRCERRKIQHADGGGIGLQGVCREGTSMPSQIRVSQPSLERESVTELNSFRSQRIHWIHRRCAMCWHETSEHRRRAYQSCHTS